MKLLEITNGHIEPLPENGSWPESYHRFSEDSINAVNTAIVTNRPLLVRGEPGIGKSQLARAVATVLERRFIYEVLNYKTEIQDLLYEYDAITRLAEAQLLSDNSIIKCLNKDGETINAKDVLNHKRYIYPKAFWWALDWESAEKQRCYYEGIKYEAEKSENNDNGVVLLIDEIDKVDTDVPNSLLETIGNNAFKVKYFEKPVQVKNREKPPLVILTTNEEKELPPAFIRRCVVLELRLPDEATDMAKVMREIAESHPDLIACSGNIKDKVAELLIADREEARKNFMPIPGQSEYIDLLRALTKLGGGEEEQISMLSKIGKFVLKKGTKNY